MSEVEALRDENSRLRDALAKIERLTQLRITEREHEANRTAVSALKLAAPATEDSSVAQADHFVGVNKMVCEWTSDRRTANGRAPSCRPSKTYVDKRYAQGEGCPLCGLPISFVEARP